MNALPGAALAVMLLALPGVAQDERSFLQDAAQKLDGYATACLKGGYPRRAKEIWLEVIREYDEDDEVARKALGFVRIGTSWAPDSGFVYPSEDTPNADVARILAARWDRLAKDIGGAHRKLADELAKDPATADRAAYHYERALRFLPAEPVAAKAAGMQNFEGFVASPTDVEILRRSRLFDRLVTTLLEKEFEVSPVPAGTTQPLLDNGGIDYRGVQTEHVVVWGNWDEEILRIAAAHAERAFEFCEAALEGVQEFSWRLKDPVQIAFFKTRDEWQQVLRANESQFPGDRLAFVLANTSATAMGAGKTMVRVAGVEEQATVEDLAVRWVAQQYTGFASDALVEGIGHAIVGLFFGRNLVFTVGQKTEENRGTSSGAKRNEYKLQLPDLDVWKELALEFAWEGSDVPAAKLPLLTAASFPNEGRIKAWSFCDYLLRRTPRYLRFLDQSGSGNKTQPDVAKAFGEKAKNEIQLGELDEEWRRFWTDDTPLLRAVKGEKTPLESVSNAAPKFLEAFNDARRSQEQLTLQPVGWSETYSSSCRDHAEYLKANRSERGPAREHTQDPRKKNASNNGRLFAERALVATSAKDPGDVMEEWLRWPGYRDGLLSPQLETIGLYVEGSILVMDVQRGRSKASTQIVFYPMTGRQHPKVPTLVPPSMPVAELGPELAEQLQKRGRKRQKEVGFPLTMHTFRNASLPKVDSIRCALLENGRDEVEGFVHVASEGSIRRTSAPGLVVFYPYEPLRKGVEYSAKWSWQTPHGSSQESDTFRFFVQ